MVYNMFQIRLQRIISDVQILQKTLLVTVWNCLAFIFLAH